ncbi:unnamed protein product [Prunus armeniaca]
MIDMWRALSCGAAPLMGRLDSRGKSDSESPFEGEPNAFDGESSDDQRDTNSEVVNLDAEGGEDTDVEIISEGASSIPTHGIRKGLMIRQPTPLAVVYRDDSHADVGQHCEFQMGDTRVPDEHTSQQSETSTSGRGEAAVEPLSQPRVSIVNWGNPRVPLGVPKVHLFGVDYLEPNKITVRELVKLRTEYRIPDSVKMRIPGPTESLSNPNDGEVVFFTDVLLQGVQLPLQPVVQKILAQIGYAPSQYNPNFWVAFMGVIVAFGIAREGKPSYEQFSYLYSVTKSKSVDHGGWVQANCLKASERGHFV